MPVLLLLLLNSVAATAPQTACESRVLIISAVSTKAVLPEERLFRKSAPAALLLSQQDLASRATSAAADL